MVKRSPNTQLKIAFIGDLCPSGIVNSDNNSWVRSIRDEVGDVDIVVANLECPLTRSNKKIRKIGHHLKASPEAVKVLVKLGIDIVTLANNHILDYGEEGVFETIEVLRDNGIGYVGAGMNLDEARRIYYREVNNEIVALINSCEREFNIASKTHGGANPLDLISLIEDINEAKSKANHVIVILHGGLEYTHYPSPQSVRLLRFIAEQAEQGVSAVVRHHPHWVQGMEVWNNTPIFYSLGNFAVPWLNPLEKPEQAEGILAMLTLDGLEDYRDIEVIPFKWDSQLNIHFLKGEDREEFDKRFNDWGQTLKDEFKLGEIWKKTFTKKSSFYFANLLSPSYFLLRVVKRLKLIGLMKPPRRFQLLLQNYLQCDTHREVMLAALYELWKKTLP